MGLTRERRNSGLQRRSKTGDARGTRKARREWGPEAFATIANRRTANEPPNSGLKQTRISLTLDPRSLALLRWADGG